MCHYSYLYLASSLISELDHIIGFPWEYPTIIALSIDSLDLDFFWLFH